MDIEKRTCMNYEPYSLPYERTLQMLRNALLTLPMACECLRKLTAIDSNRKIRWNLGYAS